jgi:hemerythrin superfamily protein
MDAVLMLERDHHEIELLFDQYDRAADDERMPLMERICLEIETHSKVEEAMFYPAVRAALGEDGVELVDEALEDHQRIARHLDQIRSMQPEDPALASCVVLLMEDVRHHVDEEESEMFPLVRANMDPPLGMLGEALEQQRHLLETAR